MPEAIATYTSKASGLWSTRHELFQDGASLGVLRLRRGALRLVVGGEWRPAKGEVWTFQRDPGLLRAQFSMWTEGREWLGSSVRFHIAKPLIEINTGGRPFHLAAVQGFGTGWALYAPKTGEVARIRGGTVEVYRKTQFPLIVFALFLGLQAKLETLLPGPDPAQLSQD